MYYPVPLLLHGLCYPLWFVLSATLRSRPCGPRGSRNWDHRCRLLSPRDGVLTIDHFPSVRTLLKPRNAAYVGLQQTSFTWLVPTDAAASILKAGNDHSCWVSALFYVPQLRLPSLRTWQYNSLYKFLVRADFHLCPVLPFAPLYLGIRGFLFKLACTMKTPIGFCSKESYICRRQRWRQGCNYYYC